MINYYVFPSKIIIRIDVMVSILIVSLIYVSDICFSLIPPKVEDFPVLFLVENDKVWEV
jgi:hypothetical protein